MLSCFSCVWLFATPWTVACQTPPSREFFRQEYWSGLPFPPPEDLPNPGIKPQSPARGGGFFASKATWETQVSHLLLDLIISQCPRLPECLPLSLTPWPRLQIFGEERKCIRELSGRVWQWWLSRLQAAPFLGHGWSHPNLKAGWRALEEGPQEGSRTSATWPPSWRPSKGEAPGAAHKALTCPPSPTSLSTPSRESSWWVQKTSACTVLFLLPRQLWKQAKKGRDDSNRGSKMKGPNQPSANLFCKGPEGKFSSQSYSTQPHLQRARVAMDGASTNRPSRVLIKLNL